MPTCAHPEGTVMEGDGPGKTVHPAVQFAKPSVAAADGAQ